MKRWVALAAGVFGIPAAFAPKPVPRRPDLSTVADVVALCQQSSLTGWELVDYATTQVNDKFSKYSAWHLWESPERAFSNSRGLSVHYNQVLAAVLGQLGFQVRVVQCARVRRAGRRPWWLASHVWVRVTHGPHERDVCAGASANCAGDVHFTPIAEVRPFRAVSHVALCVVGALPVAAAVWGAWVRGKPVPAWVYRDFRENN